MPLSRWTCVRILTAGVLASLAVGCAAVPGDPYYDGGGYYPAPSSMTVYEQPGVIYTAPPLGWRDYPPPPGVSIGLEKIGREIERELRARGA